MARARGERRLVAGFGVLVALTLAIGLVSILQIQSLATTIRELGRRHLPTERAILEMKISNTAYALGVRNYVLWRTSKYLQAVSIASDVKTTERSLTDLRRSLAAYAALAASERQRGWARQLGSSAADLERLGQELMGAAEREEPEKDRVNKLLLTFENHSYKIDELLTETLSTSNLEAIDAHLRWTDERRRAFLVALALSVLCSVLLGVWIARFVYTSLADERRLRERLVQRMLNIEEEERKNLSRQLHDQLSQDLSALKIYLGLLDQGLPPGLAEQKEQLEKSKKILGTLIERGHNISELLRPSELDELGLVGSVAALLAEQQELSSCQYRFLKPPADIALSSELSLALYRVVQEALTNIARHAHATRVEVSLQHAAGVVRLAIMDNGTGFWYQDALRRPRRRKEDAVKLGLLGLRERMELLGGTLTVDTAPGRGTRITVELPV